MKHSDDQVNERLKKALSDRFNSIHDQPDPALSKIILGSIKSKNRFTKPVGLALIAFFTTCLSIAVNDHKLPIGSQRTIHKIDERQTGKIGGLLELQTKEKQADIFITESPTSEPERVFNNTTLQEQQVSEKFPSGAASSVFDRNRQVPDELKFLDNSPFREYSSMPLPSIEKAEGKPSPASTKDHWNIMLGFTPMNTFQVVRIGAQQEAAYQNFSFPANFTRRKIAYKFQAGIENNGFQLLLNYSQVRQKFDYELATEDFVLDNQGNPIRKGLHKDWDATLHLVGAGLKKSFALKSIGLKDYYFNMGLDFSKELSSKQHAIWSTVAIGKEIRLDRNTSITAGPYLEYALNKLAAGDAGFQLQPYQIGFSFNIKYNIKRRN